MKKTLAAAITSALVIGVASTTFAAANPFSDVPRDHWSYDAVTKLAQEGVIDGYGDNTFRGDKAITRYEMAQIVAKAMVKEGTVGPDAKSLLDKLAAEYADELNNLGVRVANLEERSDNVKFSGLLRLDGSRIDTDGDDTKDSGLAKLRLNIDAQVNADWHVKGRLEANHDLGGGGFGSAGSGDVSSTRGYAEGPLFGAKAKLGRIGIFDNTGFTNGGLLLDTNLTGAEFSFGDKVKSTLTYGRLSEKNYKGKTTIADGANEFAALQLAYDATDKLKLDAGYFYLDNKEHSNAFGADKSSNGIWQVGFDYNLSPDFVLGGVYAGSNADAAEKAFDSDEEKSYSAQLTYKGAKNDAPGSYGVWLAYRQIGRLASFNPTYNGVSYGQKGYEVGVDYMVDQNILTKLVYFDGKKIDGDVDTNKLFGRVEFRF